MYDCHLAEITLLSISVAQCLLLVSKQDRMDLISSRWACGICFEDTGGTTFFTVLIFCKYNSSRLLCCMIEQSGGAN